MKIKKVKAREILDSRGNPTVETEIVTEKGKYIASVPSGASTGEHEACELRDKDSRYHGKGVQKAVANVNNEIGKEIEGMNVENQKEIDEAMLNLDGTKNKEKLGANAILSVSMAVARAGADSKEIPLWEYISKVSNSDPSLPYPCFNVVNGGEHAGNNLDIQEFMISPRFGSFQENLRAGSEIYHTLKEILEKDFSSSSTNVGDEGGFAPSFSKADQALSYLQKAITDAGYKKKVKIALDCAASEFYNKEKNIYEIDGEEKNVKEMIDYYKKLIDKYPIFSIEDPFGENDFKAWSGFKSEADDLLIIGDDLLTTNPERIEKAINENSCNGLLLKINQIGTITESIKAMKLARSKGWKIMVSHRSGETCDNFIADLAVGLGAEFIKSGAPARGERISKYNQLLRIEEELK